MAEQLRHFLLLLSYRFFFGFSEDGLNAYNTLEFQAAKLKNYESINNY